MTLENLKTSLVLATGAGFSVFGGLQYLNKYYLLVIRVSNLLPMI